MAVTLLSIGKKMPNWVTTGCNEYQKRLPKQWQFELREFSQSKADTAERRMADESKLLIAAADGHVVALDNRGSAPSTEQLATSLQGWLELGKPLQFWIGGADGLHNDCRARANELVSLSALTFPHPMVRVIWLEQLYRAHSVLINHPYHRAG
jgi:23S rRNA (pseudouridine1915-N3)-methyltransferase